MSGLGLDTAAGVLKLPESATAAPDPSVKPQLVSRQLGLITSALNTGKLVSELKGSLDAADTPSGGRPAVSAKGFFSNLLGSANISHSPPSPMAVPGKLAAVTSALKTGDPIGDTIKLLGAGALPPAPPEFVSGALSTITGALSSKGLLPDAGKAANSQPSNPEAVSGALATVTSALKSKDLVTGVGKSLTILTPMPMIDESAISTPGSALTPKTLSDAIDTVTGALRSGDLVPSGGKLADDSLPLPVPSLVNDALQTVASALHANDLIADATKIPAIILPAPLAQNVSDTLETIASALANGVSPSEFRELSVATGLPEVITQTISDSLEKVAALPSDIAQVVKDILVAVSETLKSSDELLDATGQPGSALIAPVTSTVAETLETVANLVPAVAKPVTEILDSVGHAIGAGGLASSPSPSDLSSATKGTGPVGSPTSGAMDAVDAMGTEVPDADNSTNTNPQPDGHKGKRMIICCDGTWQDSDQGDAGSPTNVTRFARALKSVSDGGVAQIIYYQSGVGSSYASKFGRLIAGGTGIGLSEHVREAFVFISNNYHVGDEIHILGFSRGAFTARSIAGLIGRIGILTRKGMENFGKIYEDYINFRLRDQSYIEKQDWERIKVVSIKSIGCWDTVGALGIPTSPVIEKCKCNDKYKFHDTDLTITTENAFHALALDEHRLPFTPTIWRLPVRASERHADVVPNLKQVWFPGVHTNIGGGYVDQEIADLTLVWMIDQLMPFLGFDLDYVASLRQGSDVNNWASGKIYESFSGVMKGAGSKVRTPGGYFPNPPRSVMKRALTFGGGIFGRPGVANVTNEEIHPSVRGRMMASNGEWCSRALFGWSCEKRIVQSLTGPVERWIWKNPETGTELFESNLGVQEKILAGTEVLNKLDALVAVPLRKTKSLRMDKVSVESKWDEQSD
ncbi:hypothetical protein DRE_03525 [Drechslerella stenobrocha 248]|uniref:T6SS Phospholipase effector Tle1-like catalytic domain-containing protein n=1 Tax=Drechslerella stenobrocha 248 TaxID=1043628 RepID=W7HSV0_9PEZI|nr:hypothetical protein DRE_03525 [Drechslerella stenobrocha 248]